MASDQILDQVSKLEPWSHLDGKIVMVTGASSGLSLEFCLDLAKAGCRIVATARRMDRFKSLCDQINQMNEAPSDAKDVSSQAIGIKLDITADSRAIEASVKRAWDAFRHIGALVNNAGVRDENQCILSPGQVRSPLELSKEEWNHVVDTNLAGSWLVSKFVGNRMREASQGGSIINISSISGLDRAQLRGSIAYSSSKAAKIMALELGDYNIRVNAIAPGLFKSEITKDLVENKWLENVAEKTIPLRTFGMSYPALTSLVRYLIHDSSNFVFGNVFIVDSGYTLPGRVHTPLDLSEEEWNDTVRTNLTGTWLVTKYVFMRMRDAKRGGSVISISIAGLERGHLPGGLAYACTKAAINTMTKVMALELGLYKIRVNSISPRLFKSEITQGLEQKDWLKNVERKIGPLRTFGTLDPALTSILRSLIHNSSEYITGNLFIVDVGVTLPGMPIFSSL